MCIWVHGRCCPFDYVRSDRDLGFRVMPVRHTKGVGDAVFVGHGCASVRPHHASRDVRRSNQTAQSEGPADRKWPRPAPDAGLTEMPVPV